MSRRFQRSVPEHLRDAHPVEHARETGVLRLYLIAIGVAILLGLVGGSMWMGWRLLQRAWLP
jgi:hypothetical protein